MPIKVKKFGGSSKSRQQQPDAAPQVEDADRYPAPVEKVAESVAETVVEAIHDADSSTASEDEEEETAAKEREVVVEDSSPSSEEESEREEHHQLEEGQEQEEEGEKRESKAPKRWIKSSKKKSKNEIGDDLKMNDSKKKEKRVKGMEMTISNEDNKRNEQSTEKTKKSKKQKTDIKKAFRNLKSRLGGKRKSRNEVQEISIKPETETPQQCWATDSVSRLNKQTPNSSRTNSAQSKTSKTRDDDDDDDGIEVIYDAAYQGGESE
ncbi:hypothetical protein LSH36_439g02014 [Paralvinella palmiformis]|uniref:Uncharacterized protein n=1 Tax=Paralvinella palmiformis TaxID=53620 RepID=A0AAD9JBH0_9ANNE|nr:hypothetical protein LSH36_439g02014 [Paralvinella palmiformis]